MKSLAFSLLILTAAATAGMAQQWEFGALGGVGFTRGLSVTRGSSSVTSGFKPGATFGAYLAQNSNKYIGGELRYGFLLNDLRLKGNGQEATFSGVSHVLHYDLVVRTARPDTKIQFFGAIGGGMKVFQGTGTENAYHPLMEYAVFTKTHEVKPMLSIGGGLKYRYSPKMTLRAEIRDYITGYPEEVLTTQSGSTRHGTILHNFVPMAGIGYVF